jgi:DNA-binding response OmpR family regulator
MRLRLVEDETALACRVQESLEEARYTVDWARDGVEALALRRENDVDPRSTMAERSPEWHEE